MNFKMKTNKKHFREIWREVVKKHIAKWRLRPLATS